MTCSTCGNPTTSLTANGYCARCEANVYLSMIQPRVALRRRQKHARKVMAGQQFSATVRGVERFM